MENRKDSLAQAGSGLRSSMIGALKVNGGVVAAYVLIFVIGSTISPKFMTMNNQMSILRSISSTALCAFGMTFVIMTGGIDLSVGSFMSLCGCLTAVLIGKYGFSTGVAITVAVITGLLFGMVNGFLITVMEMPAFIGTLAAMNILRGLSYVITGGRPVVFTNDVFPKIGTGFVGVIPLPVIYTLIVFVLLWVVLNRTRFGRKVYAVGGNIIAARYSGVNTSRTQFIVYVISGVLSAFSGIILISRLGSGQPTIGEGAELDAIAACVVGGVSMKGGSGTLFGTLIGCLIIGSISNTLNLMGVNSFIQLIVKGIIIVISVYIDVLRIKLAKKT